MLVRLRDRLASLEDNDMPLTLELRTFQTIIIKLDGSEQILSCVDKIGFWDFDTPPYHPVLSMPEKFCVSVIFFGYGQNCLCFSNKNIRFEEIYFVPLFLHFFLFLAANMLTMRILCSGQNSQDLFCPLGHILSTEHFVQQGQATSKGACRLSKGA